MATKKKACSHGKLCPMHMGIAFGLVWGLGLFALALLDSSRGYGASFVGTMGSAYIGYGPGAFGGLLGLLYGFADGFCGVYLTCWIYNKMADCC